MAIHPTAVVHPTAELGRGVEIGPFAVIGAGVSIRDGVTVMAHVVIDGLTEVGERCRFFPFSVVGTEPQDLTYRGEETRLIIGRGNTFREGVTVHRGTCKGGGTTRVGDDNLFMANSHVAHDCQVGNCCVFANSAAIAGHVEVHDHSVLGGMSGVHQHARVGAYSMVAAGGMAAKDVPPFCIVQGDRARIVGLNIVGLRRAGFSHDRVQTLRTAYRIMFREGLSRPTAVARLKGDVHLNPDVELLLDFIEASKRGICRAE